MRVLGAVTLMPGIGFIISAGITWVLASRLGLMPPGQPPFDTSRNRFDAPFSTSGRAWNGSENRVSRKGRVQ